MSHEYKVKKAIVQTSKGEMHEVPQVTKDNLPMFEISSWVFSRSLQSINTAKRYADAMVSFLNFLDIRGVHYRGATRKDINAYIKYLLFGNADNIFVIDPKVSTSTIITNTSAISSFYKWLENEYIDQSPPEILSQFDKRNRPNKKSFWYGQIWRLNYTKVLQRYLRRTKPNRQYIKWYTKTQKEALLTNFFTLRDKVIFSITLEGARIDEVLSLNLDSYDREQRIVNITRSKTKTRPIVLPEPVCEALDYYIWNERSKAESDSAYYTNYLFINLKKGKWQGHQLKYRAYWEILKDCANRAGLNSDLIRTHSGRSSKTMELLEHQTLYPEDNLTDEQIRMLMGWSSTSILQTYIDSGNLTIIKAAAEKVHRRRGK